MQQPFTLELVKEFNPTAYEEYIDQLTEFIPQGLPNGRRGETVSEHQIRERFFELDLEGDKLARELEAVQGLRSAYSNVDKSFHYWRDA